MDCPASHKSAKEKDMTLEISRFGFPVFYILELNENGYKDYMGFFKHIIENNEGIFISNLMLGKIKIAALKNLGMAI